MIKILQFNENYPRHFILDTTDKEKFHKILLQIYKDRAESGWYEEVLEDETEILKYMKTANAQGYEYETWTVITPETLDGEE